MKHPGRPNERESIQGDTQIGPVIDRVCGSLLKHQIQHRNRQRMNRRDFQQNLREWVAELPLIPDAEDYE